MSSNQKNSNNSKSTNGKSTNTFSTIIKIIIIAIVVLLIVYFCYKVIVDFINTKNDSPYFIRNIADGNTPLMVVKYNHLKTQNLAQNLLILFGYILKIVTSLPHLHLLNVQQIQK